MKNKNDKGIGVSQKNAEIPTIVVFVKMMAVMDQPIGYEMYRKALDEHPEYFPEEVEEERKWAAIPQDVKDAYYAESDIWGLFMKDQEILAIVGEDPYPNRGGIIDRVTHQDEEKGRLYALHDEWSKKYFKLQGEKQDKLYNKYFSQYGLTK